MWFNYKSRIICFYKNRTRASLIKKKNKKYKKYKKYRLFKRHNKY